MTGIEREARAARDYRVDGVRPYAAPNQRPRGWVAREAPLVGQDRVSALLALALELREIERDLIREAARCARYMRAP